MKIGIDLRMVDGGSGISRYVFELSRAVLEQDKKNHYVLFVRNQDIANQYKKYLLTGPYGSGGQEQGSDGANNKIVIADIPHYSFAEQFKLPRILNRENLDLMHFPHFNVPIFYSRPFVVTIHDLTHTLFPGQKKTHFFHRLAYNFVLKNAVVKAKKIIAVSGATKNQIVEYFGVAGEKIDVVYEGANELYHVFDKDIAFEQVAKKFKISKPFLFYVGVWRRYKNLPKLALAFDKLKDKGLDVQLVLAGSEDPFYPEIRQQIFEIRNKNDIKALGRVSDQDLALLYNACSVFVLPSLIEGFGLTVLEAASCGAAIACSDIGALREILGSAAEFFDPNNLDNMVDVLYSLSINSTRKQELANLGLKRASHFSWKQAAAQTIKIYDNI